MGNSARVSRVSTFVESNRRSPIKHSIWFSKKLDTPRLYKSKIRLNSSFSSAATPRPVLRVRAFQTMPPRGCLTIPHLVAEGIRSGPGIKSSKVCSPYATSGQIRIRFSIAPEDNIRQLWLLFHTAFAIGVKRSIRRIGDFPGDSPYTLQTPNNLASLQGKSDALQRSSQVERADEGESVRLGICRTTSQLKENVLIEHGSS